ncbi:MAG: endonuclease/exonuclease/phosphatase family protein [Bacteroidota bacterium]
MTATQLLNARPIQLILGLLILFGAISCIFTPNYFFFKMGARFAGLLMLGYLALGLVFLLLRQPRLMFLSFGCCAGLCLFLKNSSNSLLKAPARNNQLSIRVAHFNVSASDGDFESTLKAIKQSKADLISIQEVTPDWEYILSESLGEKYPYSASMVRFDPYGLSIYSKHPIQALDTFYYEEIPNFSGVIKAKRARKSFKFICAHTTPPLYSQAYDAMRNHLRVVAAEARRDSLPVVMIANLNAPPWWAEVQELRSNAQLFDSRRSATYSLSEVLRSPGDYIFHSAEFNCLSFENIVSPQSSHLGIKGQYQFKANAEKTYR